LARFPTPPVKLHTGLDNEAIDLAKGRTDVPAAVARLAWLIPPARVDLVDAGRGPSPGLSTRNSRRRVGLLRRQMR